MNFIKIKMADSMTEEDTANDVYIRPHMIMQIEPYSGPFGLHSFGPDGRAMANGKHKQILGGSLIMLGNQSRVCHDSPDVIMQKLLTPKEQEKFA